MSALTSPAPTPVPSTIVIMGVTYPVLTPHQRAVLETVCSIGTLHCQSDDVVRSLVKFGLIKSQGGGYHDYIVTPYGEECARMTGDHYAQ